MIYGILSMVIQSYLELSCDILYKHWEGGHSPCYSCQPSQTDWYPIVYASFCWIWENPPYVIISENQVLDRLRTLLWSYSALLQ